jgi:GNAT superfamily N-acetyltransferase
MSTSTIGQTAAARGDVWASDVFAGVRGQALLATGRPVDIADAVPADFQRVRNFYLELGETSTYFRFFGTRRVIPDSELRAVVAHEVPRHVTLLATMDERLIGIGEFIVGDDPSEAELAFAVADDHHHEGVATLLLERLAVVGRRCGLRRFTARTMATNQDMRVVFRTVGLTEHCTMEDGEVNLTLDLTSLAGLEAQAATRHVTAAHAAAAAARAT